jgi:hypothetical protein
MRCALLRYPSDFLIGAAAAHALKTRKKWGFPARTPNNQFKRRCDRGQMGAKAKRAGFLFHWP